MSEKINKTLRKNFWGSVSVYAFLAIKILSGFAISIILVRGLSQEEYGIYKLFDSILIVGLTLTNLGLDRSFLRYGSELLTNRNYFGLKRLLRSMIQFRVCAAILCGIAFISFMGPISSLLNIPSSTASLFPIVILILLFLGVNDLFGDVFHRVRMDHVIVSFNQITVKILIVLGFMLAVFMGKGLFAILLVMLAAETISFILYFFTNKQWSKRVKEKWEIVFKGKYFENGFIERIKNFTFYYFIISLVNLFRSLMVDNLVISYFLDAKNVAIYALAATLISFAVNLNPASMLRGVFNPIFVSRYTTSNDKEELIWGFTLLTKLIIFATLPAFTFLFLMGDKIIYIIFTKEYLPAVVPLKWLCAFFFISGFHYPFLPLLDTLEKNEVFLIGGFFSIYNLILSIVLVPKIGILGAAFATGSAGVFQLLIIWMLTVWYVKIKIYFPWKSLLKTVLNLVPVITLTILLKHHIENFWALVFSILIFGIFYLLFAFFNKIFSDKERTVFNSAIGKKIWFF